MNAVAGPWDATGWPTRHFATVPFVGAAQRGLLSQGTIEHALYVTVTLRQTFDRSAAAKALASLPALTVAVNNLEQVCVARCDFGR